MTPTNYRSANMIIQAILESIIRAEQNEENDIQGIVKSNIIRYCGLKTATAEKYLKLLEQANYIKSKEIRWGERTIIVYNTTELGRRRYLWFVQLNTELGGKKDE